MKTHLRKIITALFLTTAATALMLLAGQVHPGEAKPLAQAGLPTDGWWVCQDLGIIPLPGSGTPIQQMILCRGSEWRIQAYCTEPQKPAPPPDIFCSMVNATDFWCGDTVQVLRLLEVLATPAPTDTPTATATPTPTPTDTPTATPTDTPLPSSTASPTSIPPATNTSTATSAAGGGQAGQPTVFIRPTAGGPTNLPLAGSLAALAGGLALLSAGLLVRRRK